ncbi:MAG: ABC transporter substrate-binding protein [Acidimicrobiia bacterium]|nr:ABC transporter substrate-binding protein [Acidimicrobiia bacterium]
MDPNRMRSAWKLVAIVAGLALVAACGGGGDDDGDDGTGGGGDGGSTTTAAAGPPQAGGSIVIALGSETDGLNPTKNRFAAPGLQMASAVFDPLMAYDANGDPRPYLAESMVPNEDFTLWTLTLRPGITFHDGTPLDAEAVKLNLELGATSALTAPNCASSRPSRSSTTSP